MRRRCGTTSAAAAAAALTAFFTVLFLSHPPPSTLLFLLALGGRRCVENCGSSASTPNRGVPPGGLTMEELEAKLPSQGEASHGAPPSFSPTGIDAVVARVAEVRGGG